MTRSDWLDLEGYGWATVILTCGELFSCVPPGELLPGYQDQPHGVFHHVDESVWAMGMYVVAGCINLYFVASMRGNTPAKEQLRNRFIAIILGAVVLMATDMAIDAKMITGYKPYDPSEFTGYILTDMLMTLLLLHLAVSVGKVAALKDVYRGEPRSFLENMLPLSRP